MVARPMPVADRRALATRALAALLGLHGIGHFAGLSDSFDRAGAGEAVEYLSGLWTVTETSTLRITGVLWACVEVAMLVAAVALCVALHTREIVVAVALVSLVLRVRARLVRA
jgi:hypothetical protein